jgi:hypothetical protein
MLLVMGFQKAQAPRRKHGWRLFNNNWLLLLFYCLWLGLILLLHSIGGRGTGTSNSAVGWDAAAQSASWFASKSWHSTLGSIALQASTSAIHPSSAVERGVQSDMD